MIFGILIGMYMGLYNISIALFLCLEFIILCLNFKIKNKKLLILFLFIFLSFYYAKFIENRFDNAFKEYEKSYVAKVVSLKEEVKYYNRYILQIKSGKNKNYRILAYAKEELRYGDIIKFSEKIEIPDKARNDKRI